MAREALGSTLSTALRSARTHLAEARAARARADRDDYEGDFDVDGAAEAAPVPVAVVGSPGNIEDEPGTVPDGLRVAAGWAWRIILLGGFAYALFQVLSYLSEVTIPLFLALLFTAAFWPLKDALRRLGAPRGLAAAACLLCLLLVVAGIIALVTWQIAAQWRELYTESLSSFQKLIAYLKSSPLHITNSQIDNYLQQLNNWVSGLQGEAGRYATTVGSQLSHFFAGIALALFAMFFFLYEGRGLANNGSKLVPRRSRRRVMENAMRGWTALVAYVRAAVIVAAVDGLGALVGAALVGTPMWLAIGALTFLTAFIPLVGAIISGAVAVGVVFVTLGPFRAIIMLVVFVLVIQFEGHVMQPFLLGKAVAIHPLAVLYGIAIGIRVGGIVGGLFVVPMMAFANAFLIGWNGPPPGKPEPPKTDEFPVTDPAEQADGPVL